MAVNDIYRVVMTGQLHGQTILQTLHYRVDANSGPNDQAQLASRADAVIGLALKQNLSDEYAYQSATVQRIYPGIPTYPVVVGTTAGAGAVNTPSLPTEVCAVFTKITGFAGPRYRGRAYISGLPTTYVTDSVLNGVGVAAVAPIAVSMTQQLSFVGGASFTPILWHDPSATYTDVTQRITRTTIRSQRRRQVGVGQ